MIVLEKGLVHTMKEPPFVGSIAIDKGKITGIYRGDEKTEADERFNCEGRVITPGFIDAHTHQGLFQGEIGWAGMDGNEMTDPVTPQLRAIDALNPDDPSLKEAPSGGVTTINTGPGSANVIGGQYCVVKTHGKVLDDLLVASPSALKVAFGENPKSVYGKENKMPQTRMAIAALLREWLFKASDYIDKIERQKKKKKDPEPPDYDIKLDLLSRVLGGEIPVHAHCHRADDIVTAIRIAEEFKLRLILIHATEGHKIAEYIAGKKVPAVVGPSFVGREKPELDEISFKTAGILSRAGVMVCLQSDTFPPLKYFQSILCMAIKEGMDRDEALRAVTVNPSRLLGIDHRVGSIDVGMDADCVVWSGDPGDFYSTVQLTFVNGLLAYSAQ